VTVCDVSVAQPAMNSEKAQKTASNETREKQLI
jgi:hypothetical protein